MPRTLHHRTLIILVTALFIFPAWPGPASASALNDFNLIVLGDLKGSSSVEGRVVVFGDVQGNSKNIATSSEAVADSVDTGGLDQTDALIVGGEIKGNSVQVNNGGVRTGGSATGTHVNNADYVHYDDESVSEILDAVTLDIDATLSMLDGLTTDSLVDLSDPNTAVFVSTPGEDNIAVFDIEASFFNRNGTVDLAGALDADLIVIRVESDDKLKTGSALNLKTAEFGLEDYQGKIIWYMPDATDLTIANGFGGTLIAPNADLKISNAIEGTVVANNVTLRAMVSLPSLESSALDSLSGLPPETPQPAPVPEPASLVLLGLGMVLFLAAGRRRLTSCP